MSDKPGEFFGVTASESLYGSSVGWSSAPLTREDLLRGFELAMRPAPEAVRVMPANAYARALAVLREFPSASEDVCYCAGMASVDDAEAIDMAAELLGLRRGA